MKRGMLDQKTVTELIGRDEIDTVLMVFPDQQGRFMGKRLTGRYFVEDVLEGGEGLIHGCNYLLAVDMEMEPLPGYAYANWETGYGDLAMKPDLSTMRSVPWLEKTALVLCDVFEEETTDERPHDARQAVGRLLHAEHSAGAICTGTTGKCGRQRGHGQALPDDERHERRHEQPPRVHGSEEEETDCVGQ